MRALPFFRTLKGNTFYYMDPLFDSFVVGTGTETFSRTRSSRTPVEPDLGVTGRDRCGTYNPVFRRMV